MALTTFGAKLRKWRDENELTRRELSEMIIFLKMRSWMGDRRYAAVI